MELRHTVLQGGTLYEVLRRELRMSTSLIGRLKFRQALLVNGEPRRTNYPLSPGDELRIRLLEPEPNYPPEEGPLHISEASIATFKSISTRTASARKSRPESPAKTAKTIPWSN